MTVSKVKISAVIFIILIILVLLPAGKAMATEDFRVPDINLEVNTPEEGEEGGDLVLALRILILLTVLSLAPAILVMVTSFTRIVIVLSLIRNALATRQMPPNQVLVGLAIFLTIFIMTPVWQSANQDALQPYLNDEITLEEAAENGARPLREFMFEQAREKDLALFVEMAEMERPENREDIPLTVLIPAFVLSELKTAFQIGFLIYIPFIMIDMIVASILMSMGMLMLPPVMISLPFKLMLFVLVDGWYLVIESLVKTFG
ncbi:MAG: flagellar type III secretion system pore protein FliP [Bacillota bacterium]